MAFSGVLRVSSFMCPTLGFKARVVGTPKYLGSVTKDQVWPLVVVLKDVSYICIWRFRFKTPSMDSEMC